MALSEGVTGFGTLLKIGNGTGGTSTSYTTIAECRTITGPNLSTETVDFTHQQSPGNYRERKPTFLDAGTVTVDLTFLPEDTTQGYSAGLIASFEDRALQDFAIVWPNDDESFVLFSAFITGFQISAPIDERLSAALTLTITGPATWGNGGTS